MELNEMEKKLLFQVEGDYQTKILNELYMTVRYSNNSEQREAAEIFHHCPTTIATLDKTCKDIFICF